MTPPELLAACPTILPDEPRCGFDCPPGWIPLVSRLCVAIEAIARGMEEPPVVDQVKSKFACATVYLSHYTPEIDALLGEAAKESALTCELCGAPGELRRGSWLWTLCAPCDAARHAKG
jgi:hypothetical protein